MSDVRRDHWQRYLVVPPSGGDAIGYTRATTVAKANEDSGGLIPWKATMAIAGMLSRPGLMARWQALMAQSNNDPWYGSAESKKIAKRLVEDCSTAGGSNDKSETGTALHAIIEQGLRTEWATTPILQPGMQADVDAFRATFDAAGISVDRDLIEAMVVLDEYRVAGMSDQLRLTLPGHGDVVGDLKTSQDLKYSWQAIAIQLAEYANADNVYVQGALADGSDDRRLAMPALNKDVGLVIHLPSGQARCQLYLVDIAAGWEAFQQAMWVRGWRTRKSLARLYTTTPCEAPPTFDEPAVTPAATAAPAFDTISPTAPAVAVSAGEGGPPTPSPAPSTPPDFDTPATIAAPAQAEQDLAAEEAEPTAAPAPPPDFDAPEALEQAQSTGAPAPGGSTPVEPARPDLADIHNLLGEHPDDGGPGDDAAYNALQKRYGELPADAKTWFAELTDQSIRHRVSFHASGARTIRRFEIIRGLIELSAAGGADDETLRCVLAGMPAPLIDLDVAHDSRIEAGHLLGSLDAVAAAEFARRAGRLASGNVPGPVDPDTGRVVLDFTALAAQAA